MLTAAAGRQGDRGKPLASAALRFDIRGATTAIALVTAIAEWATVTGRGKFTAANPAEARSAVAAATGPRQDQH